MASNPYDCSIRLKPDPDYKIKVLKERLNKLEQRVEQLEKDKTWLRK